MLGWLGTPSRYGPLVPASSQPSAPNPLPPPPSPPSRAAAESAQLRAQHHFSYPPRCLPPTFPQFLARSHLIKLSAWEVAPFRFPGLKSPHRPYCSEFSPPLPSPTTPISICLLYLAYKFRWPQTDRLSSARAMTSSSASLSPDLADFSAPMA
jgi:hypothetical protein